MFGDSGDAKAKTMIVDGGTTELSPGDVLRYVKDPRTGISKMGSKRDHVRIAKSKTDREVQI